MNVRYLRMAGASVLPVLLFLSCATLPTVTAVAQVVQPLPASIATTSSGQGERRRTLGGVSAIRLDNLSRGIDLGNVFTAGANPLRYATRISATDMRILREAGFTFCRLPVDPSMLFDPREPSILRPNVRYLDRLVKLILQNGLSVVIDPIHISGRDVAFERALSSSPSFVEEIAQYWHAIASRYANLDPNRVFFEIMNEPAASRVAHAPVTWWPPVQERLARAIRAAAPRNTVIATGDEFGGIPGLLLLKPLPMPDVIYSFHFYEPMTFTHQGATWVGPVAPLLAGVPYPSTPALVAPLVNAVHLPAARRALFAYGRQRWNAARIRARIAEAAAWGARNHVPLIDGEFGVFRTYAPAVARYRWLHDVRSTLERDHIGWAMWNFDAGFNLVRYRYPGVLSGPEVDEQLLAALGMSSVIPAAVASPITAFDRGADARILLPVSWLGRLWVQGHERGSAVLAGPDGPGALQGAGPIARITHAGGRPWAIHLDLSFPVSSGQRYRLDSRAAVLGPGNCSLEIIEYGPDGQAVRRDAGALPVAERGRWQRLQETIYIPRGVTRIGLQWTGRGQSVDEISSIVLSRLGS